MGSSFCSSNSCLEFKTREEAISCRKILIRAGFSKDELVTRGNIVDTLGLAKAGFWYQVNLFWEGYIKGKRAAKTELTRRMNFT